MSPTRSSDVGPTMSFIACIACTVRGESARMHAMHAMISIVAPTQAYEMGPTMGLRSCIPRVIPASARDARDLFHCSSHVSATILIDPRVIRQQRARDIAGTVPTGGVRS